jgi:shikimate 5-dehydrogenase
LATAKGHVQTYPKNRMAPARAEEGRIKLIQTKKDCIAIAEKAKAEAAKAETLKTIQTLSEQSIQNAKTDLLGVNEALAKQPATPSIVQNKNLLLYGAVGLSAILLILLIKRK